MKYKHWLSSILEVQNSKKIALHDMGFSAQNIFECSESALVDTGLLTAKEVNRILYSRNTNNPDFMWNDMVQTGIDYVSIEDKAYPQKLLNTVNPPFGIYYIGQLPKADNYSIAIVGARMRSQYGGQFAEKLAARLAEANINVISGLACGVDSDSHRGALNAGGRTYGVLGCGVDYCYPKSSRTLYDKMKVSGGIISEYPPGTAPIRMNFPARNRIIAGLSDMTVVVEAKEKSGSLITADFAMEQGREVFALPGRITDPLSGGCNRLIEQGAGIITSIEDFLKVLDFKYGCNTVQLDFRKKLLEKDESLVYSLLDFRPISIGVILEKLPFGLSELLVLLSQLEEKGFIKEIFPNHYVKTI